MATTTIRITNEQKDRLDELKRNYFNTDEVSYRVTVGKLLEEVEE